MNVSRRLIGCETVPQFFAKCCFLLEYVSIQCKHDSPEKQFQKASESTTCRNLGSICDCHFHLLSINSIDVTSQLSRQLFARLNDYSSKLCLHQFRHFRRHRFCLLSILFSSLFLFAYFQFLLSNSISLQVYFECAYHLRKKRKTWPPSK